MRIISARDDPVITHMRGYDHGHSPWYSFCSLFINTHTHTHYSTHSLKYSLKHKKRLWRTHWRWRNECLHRGFHRGSGLKLDLCPLSCSGSPYVCASAALLWQTFCLVFILFVVMAAQSGAANQGRHKHSQFDASTANQITASETSANEEIKLSSVRMFMRI